MTNQFTFASQQRIATLYKFRAFDPVHPEYIANIFSRRELHFPAPSTLNDPFECKPYVYAAAPITPIARLQTQKKIREHFKMHDVPRYESRRRSRIAMTPGFMEQRAKELTAQLPAALDEFRLCSFSSSCDSLLMWSHYTDSHKGICLEFGAKNHDFGSALKVEYSSVYPTLEFFDVDPTASAKAMILTKSEDWIYENEYRLVTKLLPHPEQIQLHNDKFIFQAKCLIGVILGCQISAGNEKMIRDLVSAYPSTVAIKRAIQSASKFALEFVTA